MFIRNISDCKQFISGDGAELREIIHANKGDFSLHYSLAHALVKPKQTTKPHVLKSSEVYYILSGRGTMHVDSEVSRVSLGDLIYIPPNSCQYIENSGDKDLTFLCIVDPAWKPEDENIL